MKNVIKFLTFGMVLMATTSIFAQATPEICTPIYDKYIANRKGPELDKFKTAVAAGKEYLEKCKDLEGGSEVTAYVTRDLPKIETRVADITFEEEVFKPFNASVPAKDWDTAFRTGKLFLAKNPDVFDVMLVLASIGFDTSSANPPVDKYNTDAINMAKMALQKMSEGKPSETYGAFAYTYKTKDCPDGKANATGWMNYTIGSIMYYRMNQKKEALPYLYKATQTGCETVRIAGTADPIYRSIGAWYIDEFRRLEANRDTKYKELQELEKIKDPKLADAEKEYDAIVALQKGYMERVMDAYARAAKIAASGKGTAEYKNSLLNRAKEFYGFRFTDKTGFDAWYAGINAKPFPDPTSAVTPVIEVTPATGTATPGTAMTVTNDAPASNSTDTRPRTAGGTGMGSGTSAKTTTTPATTATTPAKTTTKAPAKKPAPKKKGTR